MIKKSLLFCTLLLVLHFLFVKRYPEVGTITHQWQNNVNRAQLYMYGEHKDTVMLGTSLSERINKDSIPTVEILSFGGCGVEDGLRIILYKNDIPKYILLESNYLFLNPNPDLFSNITESPMSFLRKWIPSLREKYEPICIYHTIFDFIYNRFFVQNIIKSKEINQIAKPKNDVDTIRLSEQIKRRLEKDEILSDLEIKDRLHTIKQLMKILEAKGAHFVFFEMPINEKLAHLKKDDQTREVIRREFPTNKYVFLPSDSSKYTTTDGIHLDTEGSLIYSHYIRRILNEYPLDIY